MKENEFLINDDIDKDIEEFLAAYTVKPVDEDKIDETINILRDYMPKEKEKHQLIKLVSNQVTYINKLYWLASAIIMVIGSFLVVTSEVSAYETLLFISPIPMALGILEIGRGMAENMWQLEKSFKYSYSKVILAKILIVTAFTAMINIIFTVSIFRGQDISNLLRLMTVWISPICILFSSCLIILNKTSSVNTLIATSIAWIVTLASTKDMIISFIDTIEIIGLVITIVISISILIFSILYFYRKAEDYEGEIQWN